ncbi:MAG: hypothetical protein J6Q62_07230 [Alistipes sp.]|nr:hypothetical protein [Alistipes sp.]
MKNLFKNLMLVAVAAMAFTACTESNNEVNAVTKKVVLEFVADLADDDTRVAFGEKDGNKYPVVWEAYDNVKITIGEKYTYYTLTEEDVLESGKKAIIRPEFELLEDETLSGDIVATVNEYVSFDDHQGNTPTISLKAEAVYPATTLAFEHQYAYGKMELVGLPAEFNVTEVKLNLVGGGKELNHTISGNSVEDNIFWFTTEAMEAVESFAVYASNGAVTYYREVTVEKNFAFVVGQVSAFRVKELVEKPADFNVQLTKITSMSNNVIRFEGDNAEDNITISFNPGLETIVAGHYDAVEKDWFNGGVWAWSSDSALEFATESQGSSVDVNAAGGIEWYYNQNGVDVSVDGDVYTIVAHLKNYTSSGNQTVDFTYVGKLEAPVFTSASSDATAGNYYDCYLTFEGENLGTLVLNAYHVVNAILELPVGSYMLKEAPNNFWIAGFSYFIPAGTETQYNLTSGTVEVSVVNDEYVIEFIDLAYDSKVLNTTYTGAITGLNLADPRQELPIPSNVQATVSGKTITLAWDPVEHADGYQVKMWNPNDEEKIEVVTDTQYVFEAQKSNTTYHFNVYSYANDDNASYKTSLDWEYVYVKTEDTDPKIVLSKESISFTADGGNDTVDVTLKNIDGDFTYTVDADWLTVTRPGAASLAVSAPAYDNEEQNRTATITITAGDLTKNIAVTQSKKKAAQGGQTYSTVFTSCKCVNNMDMGEGWGAKFELSNDEGLFLWLWVIQTSVNQSTGAIATGVYNFHNEWCDYATQPGFVVKKMRLPGHDDEEFGIINASFESTLSGTVNDLTFEITLEDNSTTTYTFNGTVEKAW